AREERPDMITLDVLMPGLDGFNVLQMLKQDPATESIPVILITIMVSLAEEKGLSLGAIEVIGKPVDFERLFCSIERIRTRLGGVMDSAKTVLVVDDEIEASMLVKGFLEKKNYKVIIATGGKEGINMVRNEKPDLMVLDINMPGMDGFEVIKRIKADKETSYIPIIVLTSCNIDQYREDCYLLGADKFMTKSMDKDDLMAEIEKYLG
ncbi:MAG: response regulator, partial [Elusimicrobiota bacterium]